MPSQTLILEIGIAISLVAFVGLIANKLKFSVIPFFILIGMVLGQHAPQIGHIDLTFTESKPFIDFMGRLGVLFLLFYLGLEFSVGRLIKSGKSIVTGGTVYVLLNFVSGLLIGWMMDLPFKEMMVLCGIMTSFIHRYRCEGVDRLKAYRKSRDRSNHGDDYV
ncbi:cation:proton antiporter [Sphingobacterium sp. SG20118]|uniref:cation:proton antiporter n=1 Tax=Sphingobacterium sp. SG20118 TaxID=3367156 RepID=UPI0037DFC14B